MPQQRKDEPTRTPHHTHTDCPLVLILRGGTRWVARRGCTHSAEHEMPRGGKKNCTFLTSNEGEGRDAEGVKYTWGGHRRRTKAVTNETRKDTAEKNSKWLWWWERGGEEGAVGSYTWSTKNHTSRHTSTHKQRNKNALLNGASPVTRSYRLLSLSLGKRREEARAGFLLAPHSFSRMAASCCSRRLLRCP